MRGRSRMEVRVLAAALFCLLLAGCSAEEQVTEADKALVLRAADLTAFGFRYDNVEKIESFSKKREFDGSYEIQYRFQSPQGARPLFLHVSVKVAAKESDAALNQGAEKLGLLIGFKKNGVEERELPAVPAGKLTLLVSGDRPIGNVFTLGEGPKTYLLIVSGLYFDDPALWQKVIAPKLERFRSHPAATRS